MAYAHSLAILEYGPILVSGHLQLTEKFMRLLIGIFTVFLSVVSAFAEDKLTTAITSIDADVVFMRHALAQALETPPILRWKTAPHNAIWTVSVVSRPWKSVRKYDVAQLILPKCYQASGVDAKRPPNCWVLENGSRFLG